MHASLSFRPFANNKNISRTDPSSGPASQTEYLDEDATIIYDVDEERAIRREMEEKGLVVQPALRERNRFHGIDLTRENNLAPTARFVGILRHR